MSTLDKDPIIERDQEKKPPENEIFIKERTAQEIQPANDNDLYLNSEDGFKEYKRLEMRLCAYDYIDDKKRNIQFDNRQPEITFILDSLTAGKPVVVKGLFRMGKTNLQFYIKEIRKKESGLMIDLMINAGYLMEKLSLENFKLDFGRKEIMLHFILNKKKLDFNETEIPIKVLNQRAKEMNEKILIQVDEVTLLPEEHKKWVANLSRLSNIELIVIKHYEENNVQQDQEVFAGFEEVHIKPFNYIEIKKIIKTIIAESPISFSEELMHKAYDLSGGRPYETRWIYGYLLHRLETKSLYKKVIELADVKNFIDLNTILSCDQSFTHYFNKLWAFTMSDQQKKILENILTHQEIEFAEPDQASINRLALYGILKIDETGKIGVNGELLEQYIREQLKNTKTP